MQWKEQRSVRGKAAGDEAVREGAARGEPVSQKPVDREADGP
jgi:hypothetical protein